jgi:hypothetical protein
MAFIDIFNYKKYFAKNSDAQVARIGHVNKLAERVVSSAVVTQQTDLITPVTLNAYAGRIIMAADFNGFVGFLDTTFTFNNDKIKTDSIILLTLSGGTASAPFTYTLATNITDGACDLVVGLDPNSGALVDPVVHFLIINP